MSTPSLTELHFFFYCHSISVLRAISETDECVAYCFLRIVNYFKGLFWDSGKVILYSVKAKLKIQLK